MNWEKLIGWGLLGIIFFRIIMFWTRSEECLLNCGSPILHIWAFWTVGAILGVVLIYQEQKTEEEENDGKKKKRN